MEARAPGVFYKAENIFSGAAALIKGIRRPTRPLKANLVHITSVPLPRSHHTLSVVKGRAYIFGGETGSGQLADNDMQVVILPSSGVFEADYTTIKARPENPGGEVPAPRKGHTSVVIGDSIYIFGGEGVEPENGRVWTFHTVRNTWSYLDPMLASLFPAHRTGHASVSSELPGPKDVTYREKAPQQPADPSKVVPEPAGADSWGTIFVAGGKDVKSGELLTDALAFDVRTRTWSNIPTLPKPPVEGSSMVLVGNMLYRIGGTPASTATESESADDNILMSYLDVSPVWKHAEGGTTPLTSGWSWGAISTPSEPSSTSSATGIPHTRSYVGLIPLTISQGRHLLLLNGTSPAPKNNTILLDDIWTFELPPEKTTAAATKDALRAGLKKDTHEGKWEEVGYQYVDARGDVAEEEKGKGTEENEQFGGEGKGVGVRGGFAVARGTEVDGVSCVVWGGVNRSGRVLGDGWLVTVER